MSIEQDLDISEVPELASHSFVIKIWLEETHSDAGTILWRGHITHVQSRERKYIESLETISEFILPYIKIWDPF